MRTTNRQRSGWTRAAGLVLTGLLVLTGVGCDYLNPMSSGDQSANTAGGTSSDQTDQEDQSGGDDKADDSDSKESADQAGGPDAGQSDAGGIDELTVPEPTEDQSDQPTRNPFEPKVQTEDDSDEQQRSMQGPKEPLERYALGQLKLSAIISGVAVPKAMFIAPDAMGYLVQEGDRVGQEGGEIIDIRSNAVELSIPQGPDEPAMTRTVELERRGVGSEARPGGNNLTQEEQKMLDRLMKSEQGREALRERYRGSEQGQSPPNQRSGGGLRPPGGSQTQDNR